MNKGCATVVCSVLLGISLFSHPATALDDSAEDVTLYMGETKMFPVTNLRRVAVGNPAVADVVNVGKAEFTLVPKSVGSTTLTLWDTFGEQGYKIRVYSEDTRLLKERVDSVLKALNMPGLVSKTDDANSKVLITGVVKTPQERERITSAFDFINGQGSFQREARVLNLVEVKEEQGVVGIDVQVMELNKDGTDTLGFTWPGNVQLTEVGSPALQAGGTKWSTLFKVSQGTRSAFSLKLDALIQEGKARILSRPRLSCLSGKEAELLVGGEKPNLTSNVISGGSSSSTSIEYKEFGIKLKIKPTIVGEGRLKLNVFVEVSDVGEAVILGSTAAPTALAFPLSKRSASTELYLDDGQTLSIGGLIKQKTEEDIRRMPWLSDIPVLGLFFRQKTTKTGGGQGSRGDTELFITITPTLMDNEPKTKETLKAEVKHSGGMAAIMGDEPESAPATPVSRYASIIKKRVYESIQYPPSARQSGFQGTVGLSLHLAYTGKLLEANVKSSSGYAALDDEALQTAEGVASFPPFPLDIKAQDMWVDIPVRFKLE